jgi:hypothetical protein
MDISDEQFVEIIKEKIKETEKQIKDVKSKINLYKNWHLGSPHQQRTRKKSFDKNTERLPIIEGYLNLVKRMLKEYE